MSRLQPNLRELSRDRSSHQPAAQRAWLSRYVVPVGILLGFGALLSVTAGRQLWPRQSVTVVPVVVFRTAMQRPGSPLFQAAGWVEPRPTAVSITALTAGVLEDLMVVEGQQVTKGEPVARLITIDAELDVEQAAATLAIREGELQRAQAEESAAEMRLAQPVHLKSQLAEAESLLARAASQAEQLPFLIRAAEANVEFARASLEGKRAAGSAIAGVVIQQAESEHLAAASALEELRQRKPHLLREREAFQDKVDALRDQLALLIEERRQVEEARAKVAAASALLTEAKLQLRQAELSLERTIIRAPIAGRILRLLASPGTRVSGTNRTPHAGSSTVAEMYDPSRLQVRADVRLEHVRMVTSGAPVEIETAASEELIHGRVLQRTGSANVQKNTLEVKVELLSPPPTVSPEMLVTATFIAPASNNANASPTEVDRLFVPEQLVQTFNGSAVVWIVNADSCAVRRQVVSGGRDHDGLIEIVDGLNVTDKLIASGSEGLESGERVNIRGEDPSIGVRN